MLEIKKPFNRLSDASMYQTNCLMLIPPIKCKYVGDMWLFTSQPNLEESVNT
jgi:hypothetical protein